MTRTEFVQRALAKVWSRCPRYPCEGYQELELKTFSAWGWCPTCGWWEELVAWRVPEQTIG